MKKLFVLSLGGSLLVPDEVDNKFIKAFCCLIAGQVATGARFIIVTGGGKTTRKYQQALKQIKKASSAELDWIGLYSTHLNARLLQLAFGKLAHGEIITQPNRKMAFATPVLLGGGWKPGWTTDYVAARLARTYGAKLVINLTNVDYLYDRDPNKYKNAKKIKQLSFGDALKITGHTHRPGGNYVFDPVALSFAKQHKLQIVIASGHNLKNLQNILQDREFRGTRIISTL